jgi:hypothetical protein
MDATTASVKPQAVAKNRMAMRYRNPCVVALMGRILNPTNVMAATIPALAATRQTTPALPPLVFATLPK